MLRSLILSLLLGNGLAVSDPFSDTGAAQEVVGLYVGDEKFPFLDDAGAVEVARFCSQIIVQDTSPLPFRVYMTAEGSCEEVGIDQVSGQVNTNWFAQIDQGFLFVENIDGIECTPTDECLGAVVTDQDPDDPVQFGDYEIVAASCGRQLKPALNQLPKWSCDAWNLHLLKKPKKSGKKGKKKDSKEKGGKKDKGHRRAKKQTDDNDEYIAVLTVTYSNSFDTREELAVSCPPYAVYRSQDILDSEFGIGAIQFVFQNPSDAILDPCTWDCFEDVDGICAEGISLR